VNRKAAVEKENPSLEREGVIFTEVRAGQVRSRIPKQKNRKKSIDRTREHHSRTKWKRR